MSYFKTKQALLTKLLSVPITGVTADDMSFENKTFDPKGRSIWLACYFIPATSESLGKTIDSSDEQRGIFQVSVFVALDDGQYDNLQLQVVDDILAGFRYSTSTVYNSQQVDILDSTVNNGTENEAYFKRDISINYLAFNKR